MLSATHFSFKSNNSVLHRSLQTCRKYVSNNLCKHIESMSLTTSDILHIVIHYITASQASRRLLPAVCPTLQASKRHYTILFAITPLCQGSTQVKMIPGSKNILQSKQKPFCSFVKDTQSSHNKYFLVL